MPKEKKQTKNLKAVGKIGSIQFEGWGANSGQAQFVINKGKPTETRFLFGVQTSNELPLLEVALKYMWSQAEVEVTYHTTPNLPYADAIAPTKAKPKR